MYDLKLFQLYEIETKFRKFFTLEYFYKTINYIFIINECFIIAWKYLNDLIDYAGNLYYNSHCILIVDSICFNFANNNNNLNYIKN